jgi:hypothetical protein
MEPARVRSKSFMSTMTHVSPHTVSSLTTDRLTEPVGIGSVSPEFGWLIAGFVGHDQPYAARSAKGSARPDQRKYSINQRTVPSEMAR